MGCSAKNKQAYVCMFVLGNAGMLMCRSVCVASSGSRNIKLQTGY